MIRPLRWELWVSCRMRIGERRRITEDAGGEYHAIWDAHLLFLIIELGQIDKSGAYRHCGIKLGLRLQVALLPLLVFECWILI